MMTTASVFLLVAAAGFFVGQVMKLSKGKADPKIVGGLVAKKLAAL